jgi:molybdopterin/thiamine biosynthesis adenylyltransferase
MKLLQIGCGGIGSFFVEELCNCVADEQFSNIEITIADNDMVEMKQIRYQNFKVNEVGKNKAQALAKRFEDYGITSIQKRILIEKQLKGYDFIMLCVDNEKTRDLVIRYCHKNNKEFIDLSCRGRGFTAIPKLPKLEDNLKLINVEDTTEYSCQDTETLNKGWIDKGNKIVFVCGIQMLLNYTRGMNNKIISASI